MYESNGSKRSHQQVFTNIYDKERWGKGKGSGTGSDPQYCVWYMDYLQDILDRAPNDLSILDLGCGDWQFSRYLKFKPEQVYHGIDVVPSVIEENKVYGWSNGTFLSLDFKEHVPQIMSGGWDLVLIKDVLMHWVDEEVVNFMNQLYQEQVGTIIIVNNWRHFRAPEKNELSRDETFNTTYSWSPIDFHKPPFDKYGFRHQLYYPRGKFKEVMRFDLDKNTRVPDILDK